MTTVPAMTPELIPLSNRTLIRAVYGVAAKTLIHWHETIGWPIVWPAGRGVGKTGYVPTREARAWMRRKAAR